METIRWRNAAARDFDNGNCDLESGNLKLSRCASVQLLAIVDNYKLRLMALVIFGVGSLTAGPPIVELHEMKCPSFGNQFEAANNNRKNDGDSRNTHTRAPIAPCALALNGPEELVVQRHLGLAHGRQAQRRQQELRRRVHLHVAHGGPPAPQHVQGQREGGHLLRQQLGLRETWGRSEGRAACTGEDNLELTHANTCHARAWKSSTMSQVYG